MIKNMNELFGKGFVRLRPLRLWQCGCIWQIELIGCFFRLNQKLGQDWKGISELELGIENVDRRKIGWTARISIFKTDLADWGNEMAKSPSTKSKNLISLFAFIDA